MTEVDVTAWLARAQSDYIRRFGQEKGRLPMALFDGGMAVFQSLEEALAPEDPLGGDLPLGEVPTRLRRLVKGHHAGRISTTSLLDELLGLSNVLDAETAAPALSRGAEGIRAEDEFDALARADKSLCLPG
jgi:hypothetical protein